jgi:tetratricopeptide (TPR) repeat protein
LDQALETCQTGLDADPQRPDILNTAGACCFMKKDFKTAITYFEKALDVDPSQAINYANMGSCYRELGEPAVAVKFYEMALKIDPTLEFARDNIKKLKQARHPWSGKKNLPGKHVACPRIKCWPKLRRACTFLSVREPPNPEPLSMRSWAPRAIIWKI